MKQVRAFVNENEYKILNTQAKKLDTTIYAITKSLLKGFLDNTKPIIVQEKEISLKRQILLELKTNIKRVRNQFEFIPKNELGVILLFGRYCDYLGFKVLDVHSHYPDCIAIRNGERVRIEFEYKTSNFIIHNHNLNDVDLVICWIKNVDLPIEILELKSELAHFYPKRLDTYIKKDPI